MNEGSRDHDLRQVVRLVAFLNLAYFGVEFAVALAIGSVSLFADSVDFLEDTSINFLILAALGWSARRRAKMGALLAGILLVPGLATLWTAWDKFVTPEELTLAIEVGGLSVIDTTGVVYSPLRDAWTLSRDTGVNYMMLAAKPVA